MLSSGYSQASSNTTYVALGKPIKQGWVYKKSSLFLKGFRPKYLVLQASQGEGACLSVYDQCDQSRPPRYNIYLHGATLEMKNEFKTVFRFPVFKKKLLSLFVVTKGSKGVSFILMSSLFLRQIRV
jgi:hypothetical protein